MIMFFTKGSSQESIYFDGAINCNTPTGNTTINPIKMLQMFWL